MWLSDKIDRLIGFQSDDSIATQFAQKRIGAVRKVIHLYYFAIFIPFLALAADNLDAAQTWIAGGIFTGAALLRFRHWSRPPDPSRAEHMSATAARITGAMVVLLSLAQSYFYVACVVDEAARGSDQGAMFAAISIALIAAFAQAAILTGIVFASRVVLLCFAAPLTVTAFLAATSATVQWPIAFLALLLICFRVTEVSYRTKLLLFKAQHDSEIALKEMALTQDFLVSARQEAQKRAETDGLTGIANRAAFIQTVEEALLLERGGHLMLIDVDRFKPINDIYGHQIGDLVLRTIADRILGNLPPQSCVGRLGGDEFGVYVPAPPDAREDDAGRLFEQLAGKISRPIAIANSIISVGVSGGWRTLDSTTDSVSTALRDADAALYVSKRQEPGKIRQFDDEIESQTIRVQKIENRLSVIDPATALEMVYQPIVDLRTDAIVSFEALARWHDEELGDVGPSEFFPIIESMGKAAAFTLILLEQALEFARTWPPSVRLSFNLSAQHLCAEGSAEDILQLIARTGIAPERLQFEVTETAMLVHFERARRNIGTLQQAGCRVAMDDFGAGFSSLVYLREIPFDTVKIDGSLVKGAHDAKGNNLLRGVIKLVQAMELEIIVEFVATRGDLVLVRSLGAGFAQGYHFGKPLGRDCVTAKLAAQGKRPQADAPAPEPARRAANS